MATSIRKRSKYGSGTITSKLWGTQKKKPLVNSFYVIDVKLENSEHKECFRIGKIKSKNDRYPDNDSFLNAYRFDFPKNYDISDLMTRFKTRFTNSSIENNPYNYLIGVLQPALNWLNKENMTAWKHIEPGCATKAMITNEIQKDTTLKPEPIKENKEEEDCEYVKIPKTLWDLYMVELNSLRAIAKAARDTFYTE